MDDFSSAHRRYVKSGQKIGVIGGKAYTASNVFVVRSNPRPLSSTPYDHMYHVTMTSSSSKPRTWLINRELKRRTRIAKYKLYAVEGKVKSSFKRGLRWIKHKCTEIIHGF